MMGPTFDPMIFIRPPYIDCPYCETHNSFGVLVISGNEYQRKCKHCMSEKTYSLPQITKKIIYIDQYALSKMMRAIHPETRDNSEPFWKILFGKLDRLVKLQLIICPMSSTHAQESRVTKDFKKIERINLQLSSGLSFKSTSEIECDQTLAFLPCWSDSVNPNSIHLGVVGASVSPGAK